MLSLFKGNTQLHLAKFDARRVYEANKQQKRLKELEARVPELEDLTNKYAAQIEIEQTRIGNISEQNQQLKQDYAEISEIKQKLEGQTNKQEQEIQDLTQRLQTQDPTYVKTQTLKAQDEFFAEKYAEAIARAKEYGANNFFANTVIEYTMGCAISSFAESLGLTKYEIKFGNPAKDQDSKGVLNFNQATNRASFKAELIAQISKGALEYADKIDPEIFKECDLMKLKLKKSGIVIMNKILSHDEVYLTGEIIGIVPDKENAFYQRANEALKDIATATIIGYANIFAQELPTNNESLKAFSQILDVIVRADEKNKPIASEIYTKAKDNNSAVFRYTPKFMTQ